MRVLILRGLPGSGKSSAAKMWASLVPGSVTVSADLHMFAGGQQFNHHRLEECHLRCQADFEQALKDRAPLVVVDNTNTKFSDIVVYVELIERYGYGFTVLQLHVDPKVAFERNLHGVPLETLDMLARRIWSERLPSSWDLWNKGQPWRPTTKMQPSSERPRAIQRR